MTSLAHTIIAKSDQLNNIDLITGPITIKITKVDVADKICEQPVAIHYEGDQGKPYKPGLAMRRVLLHGWTEESSLYVGRYLTIYRDDSIKFGHELTGGTRISHMSDISGEFTIPIPVSRGRAKAFTVKPLKAGKAPSAGKSPEPVPATPEQIEAAKAEARKGTKHFTTWWGMLSKEQKLQLTSVGLRRIAEDADAADPADGAAA